MRRSSAEYRKVQSRPLLKGTLATDLAPLQWTDRHGEGVAKEQKGQEMKHAGSFKPLLTPTLKRLLRPFSGIGHCSLVHQRIC